MAVGAAIAVGLWLELRQVSAGLVVAVLGRVLPGPAGATRPPSVDM